MRKVLLASALAGSLALGACGQQTSPSYTNSSGSLALSRDDKLIYAVDTDNEILAVVDAASEKKVAEIKLGRAPQSVVVAPDDTVYVANRGGRSVSVIQRGVWEELTRIPVGVEPVGMAISADGRSLFVVNSTSLESADHGTLMAIDTASQQVRWELVVGHEPRGIALVEDGSFALITLYKQGDVVKVDLEKGEIVKDNTRVAENPKGAVYFKINQALLTGSSSVPAASIVSTFQPRSAASITASPDGQTAYMTVTFAREDAISGLPNVSTGYYSGGGPCSLGPVATAGLVTFSTRDAEPQTDDLSLCSTFGQDQGKPYPSTLLGRKDNDTGQPAIQGSTVSVVDPTGAWLFIVNREGKNVAVTPTSRRGGDDLKFNTTGTTVRDQVPVGNGANGIAISRDGKALYVYNQFDHSISVLQKTLLGDVSTVTNVRSIPVADDLPDSVMPQQVQLGRDLFFDATHPEVNNPATTGVSCNTCHTEGGHEDGHVWGFPDGRRQTPALAGRMMGKTAPFHWSGEFGTLQEFMDHTARLRMGGSGLTQTSFDQLVAFMNWAPARDNPHQKSTPTDAQVRGAHVFEQAQCSTCHSGEARTNNEMADVGTLNATDRMEVSALNPTGDPLTQLNVPSLLGLARTAPYLHDGSAPDLKARIRRVGNDGKTHGATADLTDAQINDLVEFLKTL